MNTPESILQEAHRLTHGDRNVTYGHPLDDYSRVAGLANALFAGKLRSPLTAHDMALVMCCVKLSREVHMPKRDNMVDLAGYAYVANACVVEEKRRESALEPKSCSVVGCELPSSHGHAGIGPYKKMLRDYGTPSIQDVLETKPNPEINRAIDRLCELEPPKECSGSSGSECSQPQSGRTLAQGHALSRGLARDPIYDAPAIFDAPDPA